MARFGENRHSWHNIATENRPTTHIRVLQLLYEWHQKVTKEVSIAVARIIVMRNIKGSPFCALEVRFLDMASVSSHEHDKDDQNF